MIHWLMSLFEKRARLRLILMSSLVVLVLVFWIWLFKSFWDITHLRDDLIAGKYEGSLSENLGFIAALNSEGSRSFDFTTAAERRITERIRAALIKAQVRLEGLHSAPPRSLTPVDLATPLEKIYTERTLLQLFSSSALATFPTKLLGLDVVRSPELPSYPFLETSSVGGRPTAFVFVPAPLVDVEGNLLSLKLRQELVFSKIVEHDLRAVLATPKAGTLFQAYFISCSDFIRLINPSFSDQRQGYAGKFPPLRSLVDRTYFRETRSSPRQFRQSNPYVDTSGSGFIVTYSIFFYNRSLGACGMIAVDRQLETLADFWTALNLGGASGLHNFISGVYNMKTRQMQPIRNMERDMNTILSTEIQRRLPQIGSEIQRIEIGRVTAMTVPIGRGSIACFVFDRVSTERTYSIFFTIGMSAFLLFLLMALLASIAEREAGGARQLQSEIIANLNGGFVIVDDQDRIVLNNPRFLTMVEGPVNDRIITSFLAPESVNEYLQLKPRGGFEFAGRICGRDNVLSPVIITSAPVTFHGRRNQRMLILIDSAALEQTIARKFLNIFSHALKSPVHSIILIADLFRRKNRGNPALAKFDHYYAQMERKVKEFSALTNNVLRFSALDVREISVNMSPINVARVVRMVLAAVRERAEAQGLSLTENISSDLHAKADPELLQVVLNNLVDNALKYTQSGQIAIRAQENLAMIRIEVADTGPGVPKAERKDIFELFFRGASPPGVSREGLGLGLYISRRYIEVMGGYLSYEPVLAEGSQPGDGEVFTGSRFVVELPKHLGGRQGGPEKTEDSAT